MLRRAARFMDHRLPILRTHQLERRAACSGWYIYIAYTLLEVNGISILHIHCLRSMVYLQCQSNQLLVAGMAQRKTTQYYMRMDPAVKEAAEKAASDDRRSLASLIEKLLTDYCKEHGYLKP